MAGEQSAPASALRGGTTYARSGSGLTSHLVTRWRNRLSIRWKGAQFRIHEDSSNLELAARVFLDPKHIPKDVSFVVGLVRDGENPPYYTKFERFLQTNGISYEIFDIRGSSWMEDLKKFALIIWAPTCSPTELDEAREKIFVIEKYFGRLTYPTFNEVMFYENKLVQYHLFKQLGLPAVETFISTDYEEVLDWIEKCEYPIVSKIRTGSASAGVKLLRSSRETRRAVDKIFRRGSPTYWRSFRQKNYVFFQRYVENFGFDLRVIVIDENNIFGYFRKTPKNDFRASGLGNVVKTELPKEAVRIALEATKRLGFTNLSVDFLQSIADGKFYIIEASNFIEVESDRQLEIDGIPGRYRYDFERDVLSFEEGRYWIQELALKRYFETHSDQITQNRRLVVPDALDCSL